MVRKSIALLLILASWVLAVEAESASNTSTSGSSSTTTLPVAQNGSQDGQSSTSLEKLMGNKKFAENVEITDEKLKAEEGSRSRYSLKFSLSYSGPPVGEPLSKDQPNPNNMPGVYRTSLGGSISGRYRMDSRTALSVGTGISALTPFHGVERVDVRTPYLSYDRTGRVGDVQMRNSFGLSVTTIPNFRNIGQVGTLSYDNSLIYDIGTSDFAIGLDTGLSYFIYERDYLASDRRASIYFLGFYPNAKYRFNSRLNVNTSWNVSFASPRSRDNVWALENMRISQRVGLGWALTKEIYFAPYLNFFPETANLDTTTINFSTVFSLL